MKTTNVYITICLAIIAILLYELRVETGEANKYKSQYLKCDFALRKISGINLGLSKIVHNAEEEYDNQEPDPEYPQSPISNNQP